MIFWSKLRSGTWSAFCVILFHTVMKNTHFAYFVSHHDEKYAFCVFCFTLWWKIRILRILFHTMMKNGICSMVSDAKLCNNVANYGTNTYSRIGFQKMSRNKRQLMKMPCILNLLMPDHINKCTYILLILVVISNLSWRNQIKI